MAPFTHPDVLIATLAGAVTPGALAGLLVLTLLAVLLFWWWSRNSIDEPHILALKILATGVLAYGAVSALRKIHPFVGAPLAAAGALVIAVLWHQNIGSAVARLFTSGMDGGGPPPDPRPFLAAPTALLKQGRAHEAEQAVLEQVARFPDHLEALLLLAEIRALHLDQWETAADTIERIVANESLPVPSRARALTTLADWHLDRRRDGPTARALLSRIVELFPQTPSATEATQRLAHLGEENDAWRRQRAQPLALRLPQADPSLGLRDQVPEVDPVEAAEERRATAAIEVERCIAELRRHPQDTELRERLASAYADMGLPQLAVGEMEKLLAQQGHPPKQVARWLHRVADFEVRQPERAEAARAALRRIETLFPNSALASLAASRLASLGMEIRGQRGVTTVAPGRKPSGEAGADQRPD